MDKEKTFEDGKKEGIGIARKVVLDIIKKSKEDGSDYLQEDMKNEINKELDEIMEGFKRG